MSRRIFLVRHGQPCFQHVLPGIDHEFPPGDPVLSGLGMTQAEKLSGELIARGFDGTIWVSPYLRTIYTALPIARKLRRAMHLTPQIQEISFFEQPNTSGEGWRQVYADEPEYLAGGVPAGWVLSGPETAADVERRVVGFLLERLEREPGDMLIVCHGAPLKELLKFMRRARTPEAADDGPFWNCALNLFEYRDQAFEPKLSNDTGFLEEDEVTSNLTRRSELLLPSW